MASRRLCLNNPDMFCYVCGHYIPLKAEKRVINLTFSYAKAYNLYFGMKIGDQDKYWAPHHICGNCRRSLEQWLQGTKPTCMQFAIPRIWREPTNHEDDCFFCAFKMPASKSSSRLRGLPYPNVPSSLAVVPHSNEYPVPSPPKRQEEFPSDIPSEITEDNQDQPYLPQTLVRETPEKFSAAELSDLVRDLGLTKEKSELLASRLAEKKVTDTDTRLSMFRTRHQQFSQYFITVDSLTYCHDVRGLFTQLVFNYDPQDWILFIDGSTYSLKAVLMHGDALYPSIPLAHAVGMKESYFSIEKILVSINYNSHRWYVCGDFKIIAFVMGLQQGYTKHSCFLCLWNSRDRENHYKKKIWEPRTTRIPGEMNQMRNPLVDPDKILMPTLHLKLGIFRQFVKKLNKFGPPMDYLFELFPKLSRSKVTEGVFNGPQVRRILNSSIFRNKLNPIERAAFDDFSVVTQVVLGATSRLDVNIEHDIQKMINSFAAMQCNMSLKLHVLHSHFDFFKQLRRSNDQHGERFHQDIMPMEERYKGKLIENMIGDYLWSLVRESNVQHNRASTSKRYQPFPYST